MLSKMTLWDKILIGTFIIVNIIWLGFILLPGSKSTDKIIEIKVYGDIVERLSAAEDSEDIYSFEFGGNTGYVEVKNSGVRMLEMNKDICPEGICSKTGWITKEHEAIVCMPNGIVVSIKENNVKTQENDIDIIARK